MPCLSKADREKLNEFAREGNDDAVFFTGQEETVQNGNYYRGWKILADAGDPDALAKHTNERERLKERHVQKMACIDQGICNGDADAEAELEKLRETNRKNQQASRGRKRAREPTTRGKRKAANEEIEKPQATINEFDNCDCDGDDEEPLPTATMLKVVKQEPEDDVMEIDANATPTWQAKQMPMIPSQTNKEEEIELKLKKIDAEIRQANLEALRANLELERLRLKRPRVVSV